jgi:cytochrome b-561
MAFFFTCFGLVSVFDSHNYAIPKVPNLYSLHSWIGLLAVIIFGCQYVAGFFCYLFPKVKENLRVMYMPLHVFFGLIGFILCLIAVLMGLSEKAFFSMANDYQNLPSHALLVNTVGLLTALFGSLVIYLVTEPSYKREPLPEDSMLLTGDHE